jgi:septal ring factor EnvC (AmiA/AmiB activator)
VRPYIDYSFVEDGSKEVFTTVASHHDDVKEMRKELTEFYTLIAETNTQLAETKSKLAKTINQVQFLEESERKKKAAIHEACKTLLQVTQTLLDQTL